MLNRYDDAFLLDKEFLRLLDLEREKEVFVKIISLDFNENPLETIEGRVTSGSVNVDGTSSVRRTCSLSLVANELNIHDFYWGLNTKFKLFVGVKNVLKHRMLYKEKYAHYPDICWFKMGTYIVSSFSTSQSTSSYTISISGKDKMAFLNGEVGGIITPLSWDFGKIDEVDANGFIKTTNYLIRDIILESVHEHSQDPYWNIIINDLDDYGLELLEYKGTDTLYLLYNTAQGVVDQMIFDLSKITTKDPEDIHYDPRIQQLEDTNVDKFKIRGVDYTIIKVERGDVVGYRITDLVYPGDLISNIGESVTSMLDKIVSMLGEFEYFYDLDGRFIFQRKKTYIQSTFSTITKNDNNTNEIYISNAAETSACTYSFDNSLLVTSFSNSPNFADIKNDFSIWGVRKGSSGIEIPIHLRYAIDSKPWMYTTYDGRIYITAEGKNEYNRLMTEYTEWFKQKQEDAAEAAGKTVFKKIPVPVFLQNSDGSSDWWDIKNWAEYYRLLTEHLPEDAIGSYGTQGFTGTLTFPNGQTMNFGGNGQLVIDLERSSYNLFYGNNENPNGGRKTGYKYISRGTWVERESNGSWSPTQHGFDGCWHTYREFLYLDANNNCQSFIYKPEIPTSALTDEVIAVMENVVIEDLGLTDQALECDWRELIYQMSLDYNKYHHDEDFLVKIDQNNTLPDYTHLYPGGFTGYEKYYIDLNGFWRTLYDPYYKYSYYVAAPTKDQFNADINSPNGGLYYVYQSCDGMSYADMKSAIAAWKSLCGETLYYYNYKNQIVPVSSIPDEVTYNQTPEKYCFIRRCKGINQSHSYTKNLTYNYKEIYHVKDSGDYDPITHWTSELEENPEGLNFWFDFLDTEGQLGQYKVCKIGDRAKANNDTNVKSIYFRDVPTVIFVNSNTDIAKEQQKKGTGYTYIKLPQSYENLFSMSSQGKSAMDVLNDWIYSYAYCAESISINALPVYYLEPNTRIMVRDDNSGINGEYIVTRLTFPLTHNGTMSITATKAVENLY